MDVLSEVLRIVRLSGAMHFSADFTAPWAFSSSPPALFTARLKLPGGSVTPFHVIVDGHCWVTVDDLPPMRIGSGDVIVFPRCDQHVMASGLDVAPVPIADVYRHPSDDQITHMAYGGGGTPARFVCGYLHFDHRFSPLLDSLPPVLCIRSRDDAIVLETLDRSGTSEHVIDQPHEVDWWKASLRYLVGETLHPGAGNHAVLGRMAESLFIEVVRWRLRYTDQGSSGWLAGLHDPQVGRVLRLLHTRPEYPWTVEELAREAAMSRAALAQRFVALVGQSPIEYLTEWRMHVARHLLEESQLGLGEIAERVGYASEAAFSRAFRRTTGLPPGTWRRSEPLQRMSA